MVARDSQWLAWSVVMGRTCLEMVGVTSVPMAGRLLARRALTRRGTLRLGILRPRRSQQPWLAAAGARLVAADSPLAHRTKVLVPATTDTSVPSWRPLCRRAVGVGGIDTYFYEGSSRSVGHSFREVRDARPHPACIAWLRRGCASGRPFERLPGGSQPLLDV